MIAVTGANGHLGQRLLRRLALRGPVRALVRSERAAGQVAALGLGEGVDVRIVDYADAGTLGSALAGCRAVVHLVGILKEGGRSRYRDAHEDACEALVEAAGAAGVERIVYLSIVGATPSSDNDCLASKGAAERLLLDGPVPACVIRVPMVLGEEDYATAALSGRARRGLNLLLRGASLEQPIYAGDVIDAVVAALDPATTVGALDLAGPESLPRAELVRRAAAVLGRRTRTLSLPLGLGLAVAGVLETLLPDPPVTRAMLGVLDHDDRVDTAPALAALGIELTPLDETLRRCLAGAETP
jgi:NADH dehydrogenase